MSYMALYRKFRPRTFGQVKGQEHVVRTLTNQIKNGRIGHAYLFTGTRGTGKTSVAKLFARAINCPANAGGEPCNECENCLAAIRDAFMDIVEVDAASNTGVDDIRRIIEEVQYPPVKGEYKVYIIDEAHMLSGPAFNAFLKTLEEPPAYAVFILATTEPHKLPITILSRCQRYDFHRIGNEVIADNLAELATQEGIDASNKALAYIAQMGDGSMRDAISLLDKCIAFNLGNALTYENVLLTLGAVDTETFSRMFRAIYAGDSQAALKILNNAVNEGKDLSRFVNDFVWYIRNLLMAGISGGECEELLGISRENIDALMEDARGADGEVLVRYIRILSQLLADIKFSPSRRILAEVAVIKMAVPQMESDAGSLADRIRQMEERAVAAKTKLRMQPLVSAEQLSHENVETGKEAPPEPATQAELFTQSDDGLIWASWKDIVSMCEGRVKAAIKKVFSVEETGDVAVLSIESGASAGSIREYAEEIEKNILQVTGRNVRLSVKEVTSAPPVTETDKTFPEELLSRNINFDIGTEEM
ncbi:MAG: DNA polymerase III subunit gamma/tau [Lachnospiraceae bacterium]|jgi:DNA polymerase-3 subunit gamma/tau